MPRALLAPQESYHIFNRGINKQAIFLEKHDYVRMLFLVLFLQSPKTVFNIGRHTKYFIKHGNFGLKDEEIINNKTVELVSFALMPNHFHLFVRELKENGVSKYLQRIEIAYTKYFNTKYRRSGYLFQGPFQSVHVDSNEQALHLSAYIHLNSKEIKEWSGKEHLYQWSSYMDLTQGNRWDGLLSHELISGQFSNREEYKHFVETSGAKEKVDGSLTLDGLAPAD